MDIPILSTKPGFSDVSQFDIQSTPGYWQTALWNVCLFNAPLFGAHTQTITDLISEQTANTNDANYLGGQVIWTDDSYGDALKSIGIYAVGPTNSGFTFNTFPTTNADQSFTFVYLGRISSGNVALSNLFPKFSTGKYGLTVTPNGTLFIEDGASGTDTGLHVTSNQLKLIGLEYNATNNMATLYINGSPTGRYSYTPFSDLTNPQNDVLWGAQTAGYMFWLSGNAGAAFHAKLAQDVMAPYLTYLDAALGIPYYPGRMMRS